PRRPRLPGAEVGSLVESNDIRDRRHCEGFSPKKGRFTGAFDLSAPGAPLLADAARRASAERNGVRAGGRPRLSVADFPGGDEHLLGNANLVVIGLSAVNDDVVLARFGELRGSFTEHEHSGALHQARSTLVEPG